MLVMTLDQYLKKTGMTDADFAKLVGMNRSQVGRLRRGEHRPRWATVDAIEKATKRKVKVRDWEAEAVPS